MCQPPAMSADRPAASDGGPVVSHTRSAIASLRRAARLFFDRCATAPETRPQPTISRAHAAPRHRPIVQRCPTGGGSDSPGSRPGADGRCAPPYPPPAVLGVPLPAILIVRRWRWGHVICREQRRVRLVITPPPSPPPAIQL